MLLWLGNASSLTSFALNHYLLKKVKDGKINDANCFPLVLWAWHAEKYAPKPGSITVRSRILFAVA